MSLKVNTQIKLNQTVCITFSGESGGVVGFAQYLTSASALIEDKAAETRKRKLLAKLKQELE